LRLHVLHSVISLLKVSVSALGENETPHYGPADLGDVADTITIAVERLKGWLRECAPDDPTEGFQALDVLALSEAVLGAGLEPSTDSITVSPVRGGMELAAELLERLASSLEAEAQSAEGGT